MIELTIVTPTYNRCYTLQRVYNSIVQQNHGNVLWLVIDDGSTDETSSLIEKLINKRELPITYIKKENGGRHTALNLSYQYIKTEWYINMDSDDEFYPGALHKIKKYIKLVNGKKNIWCISGRCIDNNSGKMVGRAWPRQINSYLNPKQRHLLNRIQGEKSCVRRLEIVKKNLFPVVDGIKFIPEGYIWDKIQMDYETYCVDDVFRIYHTNSEDSLAKGKIHKDSMYHSYYYGQLGLINYCSGDLFFDRRILLAFIKINRFAYLSGRTLKGTINDINKNWKKIVCVIVYPLALIYVKIEHIGIKKYR